MINVGDLAVVVRWPCCGHFLGFPMKVGMISTSRLRVVCSQCGHHHRLEEPVPFAEDANRRFPLAFLRKIDPLTEPEDVEHKEEIPA